MTIIPPVGSDPKLAEVVRQANRDIREAGYGALPVHTVATLPKATPAGRLIYVADGTANQRLAVSDGTNWRFPSGSIVS